MTEYANKVNGFTIQFILGRANSHKKIRHLQNEPSKDQTFFDILRVQRPPPIKLFILISKVVSKSFRDTPLLLYFDTNTLYVKEKMFVWDPLPGGNRNIFNDIYKLFN